MKKCDIPAPDRYRGRGAGGPHRWGTYWQCLSDAIELFGDGNAGSHFMVGVGETERDYLLNIPAKRGKLSELVEIYE